jgi:hypothetical protein
VQRSQGVCLSLLSGSRFLCWGVRRGMLMQRDPHRLTYRVRRIPSTWSVDDLNAALLEGLGITDPAQVRVRVLATDLTRFNRERCRTAIVSFGLADHSFSTRFSLEGRGAKLECDTIFDDLTPLSSCDGDERHNVEYVSPYTYFSPDYGPRRSGRCALLVLLLFKPTLWIRAEAMLCFPARAQSASHIGLEAVLWSPLLY